MADAKIPYAVYETAQYGHPRKFRGVYEITVAIMLVVIIALGSVWLYRRSNAANAAPRPMITSSHSDHATAPNVTQSPQSNASLQQPINDPSQTKTSNTTNQTTIPAPVN